MKDTNERIRRVRPLKIFFEILRQTHTYKILVGYIILVFVMGLLIMLTDENINNYGDALWYCYAVLSTVGFGDVVVTGTLPRILSVILTVYSIIIIAIITGAIVNLYSRITEITMEETMENFINEFEHLQELDKEELSNLSKRVSEFKKKLHE
ncbi:MAG: potassium channel family protein [Lachnospiraceae bacterium]|nr:potassium channel family protein [Lachnospiraceae bacterium]